ncbi:MAG TPA: hypothetical protein VK936_15035 [Longimicrobiales bacterium]|nr:hypothetical protein [Longimicrobiales bacterium]
MSDQQRTILIAAAAAILAFAIGALWQYAAVRSHADRLAATTDSLTFQRLEATLGAATIEAQRGSYEISRQLASDFFSGLQTEIGAAAPDRGQAFADILQQRDAMITALSRYDAQSGALLAQLFTRYRIAMGEPVGPTEGTRSTPPDTGGTEE